MYRKLTRDASLPAAELEALAAERAIKHARFAMEHTPFYRDLYSSVGLNLRDLEDPAAFGYLPTVTKADVRNHAELFRSTEATDSNSSVSATGGSTGEPLHLLRDLRTPTRTLEWRLFDWWGVHPSDDIAILRRRIRTNADQRRHDFLWWPSKRIQIDAYRMDDERVDVFAADWERVRPRIFVGYVGGVVELARFYEARGARPNPPEAIAVTAAPLTEAQRTLIQDVFRAPVYDHYRSSEVPWIAGECRERNGLHVFADVRKVEILDDDGKPVPVGEVGQVVASDLTNRVFPLIRYEIGD
ncbi:MAG: hypothetical protein JWM76_5040, partial [Pseudonocardiales bacterium]|nr:hypothetical protein [Pseudonocardiales bacterium]